MGFMFFTSVSDSGSCEAVSDFGGHMDVLL